MCNTWIFVERFQLDVSWSGPQSMGNLKEWRFVLVLRKATNTIYRVVFWHLFPNFLYVVWNWDMTLLTTLGFAMYINFIVLLNWKKKKMPRKVKCKMVLVFPSKIQHHLTFAKLTINYHWFCAKTVDLVLKPFAKLPELNWFQGLSISIINFILI